MHKKTPKEYSLQKTKQTTPTANDSYKLTHREQLIPDTNLIYSHLTPRFIHYLRRKFPQIADKVIVYGLQSTIKIVTDRWQTRFFDIPWEEVSETILEDLTTFSGWTANELTHFRELHTLGYLPLEFKGLPEGTLVEINIPVLTVKNTLNQFAWLTNFVEPSILQEIYKPMTVATLGLELARLRDIYFERTVVDDSLRDFALHDFSYRGQSGHESGAASISGYLLHTKGTDTLAAVRFAKEHYEADQFVAGSIPAYEHSTATLNIQWFKSALNYYDSLPVTSNREAAVANKYKITGDTATKALKAAQEVRDVLLQSNTNSLSIDLAVGETFALARACLEVYPTGPFAYVSDSYNLGYVVTIITAALKEVILSRDGKLVIRPDSGRPVNILCGLAKTYPKLNSNSFFDFKEEAKLILLDRLVEEVGFAIKGPSEYSGIFNFNNNLYKVDLTEISWDQAENRFYYVSDTSGIKIHVEQMNNTWETEGVIQSLWKTFGGTVNEKGYKVLDPHIGVVYGDGMNYQSINNIYKGLEELGFAASCVVLS